MQLPIDLSTFPAPGLESVARLTSYGFIQKQKRLISIHADQAFLPFDLSIL
jgi:hypothetical protein